MGQQIGPSAPVVDPLPASVKAEELVPSGPVGNERSEVLPARTTHFWGFALVGLQLALILLVVCNYEVGSRIHFFPVLCVAVGGFLVHACLPPRFRLGFFCLL